MNYSKVQADILKAKDKTKFPYLYGHYNKCGKEYIAIIIDGKEVVLIPEESFYLDAEKCFGQSKLVSNIERICNTDGTVDIRTDGTIKPLEGNSKHKVQIFTNGSEEIWVSTDLLKIFDMSTSHFKGINKKTPVFIYEEGNLVGLVWTINHQ